VRQVTWPVWLAHRVFCFVSALAVRVGPAGRVQRPLITVRRMSSVSQGEAFIGRCVQEGVYRGTCHPASGVADTPRFCSFSDTDLRIWLHDYFFIPRNEISAGLQQRIFPVRCMRLWSILQCYVGSNYREQNMLQIFCIFFLDYLYSLLTCTNKVAVGLQKLCENVQ